MIATTADPLKAANQRAARFRNRRVYLEALFNRTLAAAR